jgi:hypothetical protein
MLYIHPGALVIELRTHHGFDHLSFSKWSMHFGHIWIGWAIKHLRGSEEQIDPALLEIFKKQPDNEDKEPLYPAYHLTQNLADQWAIDIMHQWDLWDLWDE